MNIFKENIKYIFGLIILLIVLGVGFGIWKAQERQKLAQTGVIHEKTVNLSVEERQRIEAQMKGYSEQIKGLSGDTLTKERNKVYILLAGTQYKLGQYSDALKSLDIAAPDNQDSTRLWSYYTFTYRDMGDISKAYESAKKLVDLDQENPQNWQTYIDIAVTAKKSNDEIKELFLNAVKKTDADTDLVISFAKFLEAIGDKPGAISMWVKAGESNSQEKTNYDAEIARLQK